MSSDELQEREIHQRTVEYLAEKVKAKEDEANEVKKMVNKLCDMEGLPRRYQIAEDAGGVGSIHPLAATEFEALVRDRLEPSSPAR